jgi:hypothetical protein
MQVSLAPKNPRVFQFLKGVYKAIGRFFDDSDENMFTGTMITELTDA